MRLEGGRSLVPLRLKPWRPGRRPHWQTPCTALRLDESPFIWVVELITSLSHEYVNNLASVSYLAKLAHRRSPCGPAVAR